MTLVKNVWQYPGMLAWCDQHGIEYVVIARLLTSGVVPNEISEPLDIMINIPDSPTATWFKLRWSI